MRRTCASLVALLLLPSLAASPTTRKSDEKPDVSPRLALQKKLGQIKFSSIALEDAVDYIRDVTGANIHVNWRALELLNVTRQTPVSLQLNDVSARRALRSLLDEAGVGDQLTWYVDDGVIEVTTKELADSQLITRVYPVNDLVMEVPNFAGPRFNLQSQNSQTSGGGGGGGGGGGSSLFDGGNNTQNGDAAQTKAQRADSLVALIKDTVKPEVWRDNGGTASIRYFNGHIIVTAPRSVHEAISGKPE